MELSALGGNDIFETYARNAVIGRGENYPGYYATGYTDIPLSARFPYEGPDVSSIYFHHIPAYLAMMQDYLVSEFTARSNGAVSFEPARQEGFVWFANNIYGNSRGKIDGTDVRLYMPRGAVKSDNVDVNVLTARSAKGFHILLSNDGNSDADVTLTLGEEICRRTGHSPSLTAKVAARDVAVISLDADFSDLHDAAPLADGMEIIETGTAAGTVYLFRIRSPFGYDSLYGFAACGEVSGQTITAECGVESRQATSWPYEWSLGKVGYGEAAEVTVTITRNGNTLKTVSHTFSDDSSEIENIAAISERGSAVIYTLDGRRANSLSRPGIYIVNGRKILRRQNF